MTNIITFIEDELIEDVIGHINSLHITVECKGMITANVLIDNGSIFNVCTLIAIDRSGIEQSSIERTR